MPTHYHQRRRPPPTAQEEEEGAARRTADPVVPMEPPNASSSDHDAPAGTLGDDAQGGIRHELAASRFHLQAGLGASSSQSSGQDEAGHICGRAARLPGVQVRPRVWHTQEAIKAWGIALDDGYDSSASGV